jgi:hypothetical protein
MKHEAIFETRMFEWVSHNDEPKAEDRVFWTCSCGSTDNRKGGYVTMHKAVLGHKLHAQRTGKKK